jgi:hypothetical protein
MLTLTARVDRILPMSPELSTVRVGPSRLKQ